jgi:DNA invertase Pin-like site-specific DNA recombinase
MQIVGSFAEFERAMLRERTRTGLEAARQEGRVGGRRPKLSPQQQKEVTIHVPTLCDSPSPSRVAVLHRADIWFRRRGSAQ